MTLVKWNPWADLTTFKREVDRFVNPTVANGSSLNARPWMPHIDLHETETAYVINADLPGMSEDDIAVTVEGETVVITGERKSDTARDENGWKHIERTFGKFKRTFHLPAAVKVDDVQAHYRNGVLTVNVPKPEDAKTKRIAIQAA